MKYCIALLICLLSGAASAQRKFEKEVRIRKRELSEQVPKAALEFVAKLPCESRIRWYREEGYNGHSFEAKTRIGRQRISIEFSAAGVFEDIEADIKAGDIANAAARQAMEAHLRETYRSYRVEKIQIQYSGDAEAACNSFGSGQLQPGAEVRYEWVISAKTDNAFALFEYLFDASGNFVQRAEIDLAPADNIEY